MNGDDRKPLKRPVSVRLIGLAPKIEPVAAVNGRYELDAAGLTAGGLADRFGLSTNGVSILVNGRHRRPDERIEAGDDVYFMLIVQGG